MSEPKPEYITEAEEMIGTGYDDQHAAVINPPQKLKALSDNGLVEYQAWGWVKTSAKFIAHIKKLKGAKLAIWMCIALSIDENGKCKRTIKELCALTGYSHTELISSLHELGEGGYLSINKDEKTNIYTPEFVARGGNIPSGELVKKLDSTPLDSTPVYQYESTPPEENPVPTFNRVKRVNIIKGIEASMWQERETTSDDLPDYERREKEAIDAFEQALNIPANWQWHPAKTTDEKVWRDFRAYLLGLYEADPNCFVKYAQWRRKPFAKGAVALTTIKRDPSIFASSWAEYLSSDAMYGSPAEDDRPEYKKYKQEDGNYVPRPKS